MQFSVRHSIPGRVRLYIPALHHKSDLADAVLAWLGGQPWVVETRANHACASLIVAYDKEKSELLDMLLALLRSATLKDLRAMLEDASGSNGQAKARSRAKPALPATVPPSMPLLWPSISLALAFSGNPFIRAANVPLMLWNSLGIFRRAWNVWKNESRLNVDFLDTLAILASLAQGLHVTGGIIVWLIRLGDWIRDLTAAGSRRAVSELLEFQAKTAWRVRDGEVKAVPVQDLVVDDTIIVYHGELIPVDGEVVLGHALLDQKMITGESLPVSRDGGDAVFAGSIVREGQLTIRALRIGSETMAGQIAQLVESAPIGDTRMQNHAERFADRLVLRKLSLAAGTALVTADFNRFLSLVIVDFGTGIRVAAPTCVLTSMTHAARSGIVIKSGAHMEKLAEADTIVFDKTGTLTHGVPAVREVLAYGNRIPADHLLGLAVAAETRLKHPVAEALRTKAQQLALDIPPCEEAQFKVGLGVEGQVNGYYVHVGNERYFQQSGIRTKHVEADCAALNERGESCVLVGVDGVLAGVISYADQIRPESRSVIEILHNLGVKDTIMLTGDNAVVARAVGGRLGLKRHFADLMPTDKVSAIQDLQRSGRVVAMVGDGINDSPALCYADIGIAMKHGADITRESADVLLMEDSLWKLVKAVEISRGAVRLIKQNYGIVAVLNTLALGLALPSGLVTPTVTAVLSNGSAVLAALNGMRPLLRDR